jgi:hypothetical protein
MLYAQRDSHGKRSMSMAFSIEDLGMIKFDGAK